MALGGYDALEVDVDGLELGAELGGGGVVDELDGLGEDLLAELAARLESEALVQRVAQADHGERHLLRNVVDETLDHVLERLNLSIRVGAGET